MAKCQGGKAQENYQDFYFKRLDCVGFNLDMSVVSIFCLKIWMGWDAYIYNTKGLAHSYISDIWFWVAHDHSNRKANDNYYTIAFVWFYYEENKTCIGMLYFNSYYIFCIFDIWLISVIILLNENLFFKKLKISLLKNVTFECNY